MEIEKLIKEEYARASAIYGEKFSSTHEGESVIREKMEEAVDSLNYIVESYKDLWTAIRQRDEEGQRKAVYKIRCDAVQGIEELVQVAAMCDKFLVSFKYASKDEFSEETRKSLKEWGDKENEICKKLKEVEEKK